VVAEKHNYTDAELKDFNTRGHRLAVAFEQLVRDQPKMTVGTVVHATAYLFASSASTQAEAEKMAKDVGAAIVALWMQKEKR
jgi:hypothetical protein